MCVCVSVCLYVCECECESVYTFVRISVSFSTLRHKLHAQTLTGRNINQNFENILTVYYICLYKYMHVCNL